MARLAFGGFEGNDGTLDLVSGAGSGATSTTVVRTGNRSWLSAGGSTSIVPGGMGVLNRFYYARIYLYLTTLPVATTDMFGIGAPDAKLRVSSAGVVTLNTGANVLLATGPTIVVGRWYRFEIADLIQSGNADDSCKASIDGVEFANLTAQTLAVSAPTGIFYAGLSDTYFDDWAINDDQGANQNSYPGEGSVAMLLPTADSAVGTGWTLGTGTAISANGFGSVDNTPPTGVADLAAGSDPKQIRNATSNANTNYDATMSTYASKGIGALDTINVIVPLTATAAPVSTSAKQGTVGVVSNPTIANVALGAGGTSGAFWSGTAGGTYATGWKISYGTITYNAAITNTTAPVMRITQVTSSTRIAVVCFMGIYVDYTGVPPPLAMALPNRNY